MTNGNPAAPHVTPHGLPVDPSVLLSMLATLAAGSQSSMTTTQPASDNSRNGEYAPCLKCLRTYTALGSWSSTPHPQVPATMNAAVGHHIVPPEELPPSPMMVVGHTPPSVNHAAGALDLVP